MDLLLSDRNKIKNSLSLLIIRIQLLNILENLVNYSYLDYS